MFDENNFSNDNSYEQNNSQAVPGGSVAAHTDNNLSLIHISFPVLW